MKLANAANQGFRYLRDQNIKEILNFFLQDAKFLE